MFWPRALALLALATMSTAVLAADPAVFAAPVEERFAHDWSGIYVGALAGYGLGDSRFHTTGGQTTHEFSIDGFVAGGTAGYNHQIDQIVLGLETDFQWSGVDGGGGSTQTWICADVCSTDIDWFGTFRGRLGFAVDRYLPYFTVGAAYARVSAETEGFPEEENTETKWGFVFGAGLEYAATEHVSVKAEYLYTDLGSIHLYDAGVYGEARVNADLHQVRLGLNYGF